MICKVCGNEIMSDALFCANCGTKTELVAQEADSDRTVVLWDEEPQVQKQDDDRTVVLWDEEPQVPKQDDDRTVVLWDEEPQQGVQGNDVSNICPNCGAKNMGDVVFCVECGAMMSEIKQKPTTPPMMTPPPMTPPPMTPPPMTPPPMMQQNVGQSLFNQAKPPKGKDPKQAGGNGAKNKLPLIIAAAAAVIVAVIIGAVFVLGGSSSKSVGNDLVYLKDNELYIAQDGSYKPQLVTDSLYEDKDNANYYGNRVSTIQYTEDGKYMFYEQDIDGGEFDLYYKKAGAKEEGTKFESGINSFIVHSANVIVYKKDDKLYLANLKDKEKLGSDISAYWLSEDKQYVCWYEYDGDYTLYVQDVKLKKDKVKIKDVSSYIGGSEDLKEIYYMSEDTLYLMKNLSEKVKISSDVYGAYMLGEKGNLKLHYVKLEDENSCSFDKLVKNDVDGNSEYSYYEDYALQDLENQSMNISEYTIFSYSAGSNKSEEIKTFNGEILYVLNNFDYSEHMVLFWDVDVKNVDKLKLSNIIEDFYNNYSYISLYDKFSQHVLTQADFYLMTVDGLKQVSGMGEIFEKSMKSNIQTYGINSATQEIYMSFYYQNKDNDYAYVLYTIPYAEKESACKQVSKDIYYGSVTNSEMGIYYICDVDDEGDGGTLLLNGTEIAEDVFPTYIEPSEKGVYYIKDINSDHDEGTLCINKNGKETEIAEDVAAFNFEIIKDGNVAYLVDYSFKKYKGDLFVFTGKKSAAVDTEVTYIFQP